jgi:hypothetical protein
MVGHGWSEDFWTILSESRTGILPVAAMDRQDETVSKPKNRVGNAVGLVRRGSRSAPAAKICPEAILRHLQMPVLLLLKDHLLFLAHNADFGELRAFRLT